MVESEWAWFRGSLAESLVRPGLFARRLAREHYGLAGVFVALLAGAALSVTIDVGVILSRGADPLAFVPRLLADAFFLGTRLAIATALLSLVATGVARLARRRIALDQAFTALCFAAAPFLFAPLVVLLMLLGLKIGPPARDPALLGALGLAAAVVLRVVLGVSLNFAALVGGATVVVASAALLAGAMVMQDQISRVAFTALAYAPYVLPPPASAAVDGQEVRVEGLRFRLPLEWREANRGVPGIAAQYELPDARLRVRLKNVSVLTTADSFAASELREALRDFTRVDRTVRSVVRIGDVAALDHRWYGWIDEVRLIARQYALLAGGRGYLFEIRFFAREDEEAALDLAARIAASIERTP
jgi:hypothetical protein